MTQWQVGKTYEFIPEMTERFIFIGQINRRIHDTLKGGSFTVTEISECGDVTEISGFDRPHNFDWWFYPEEIKYFREVNPSTSDEIVINWLDKLYYVMRNDDFTDHTLCARCAGLSVDTEDDAVEGSSELYKFINERYKVVHEANQKQLQSKREQLLAELAEIDKQLGGK